MIQRLSYRPESRVSQFEHDVLTFGYTCTTSFPSLDPEFFTVTDIVKLPVVPIEDGERIISELLGLLEKKKMDCKLLLKLTNQKLCSLIHGRSSKSEPVYSIRTSPVILVYKQEHSYA